MEEPPGEPRLKELSTPCLAEQQREQDTAARCELGEGLSVEKGEGLLSVADVGESWAQG